MNVANEHQPLDEHQQEVVDTIKKLGNELGNHIEQNVRFGRRRQLALTNLETALMYAVKAAVTGDQ